ncbi:hypothetical protein B0H15DRAFT_363491 [Mycena belliarum]|uniref:Uncharacterized protein n=1 Tax=Mycena belliarum TaxID=1033014 RepID=A0AAD6XPR4_9AGAR|nr:hypothetical protein B0H15DRAFT_363491 [Mycena belliae]
MTCRIGMRSGQLPIAQILEWRSMLHSGTCRLRDGGLERKHAPSLCGVQMVLRVEDRGGRRGGDPDSEEADRGRGIGRRPAPSPTLQVLHAAKFLFIDEPFVWPLKITQYYLGQVPSTQTSLVNIIHDRIRLWKLSSHIVSEWHTAYERNTVGRKDFRQRSANHGGEGNRNNSPTSIPSPLPFVRSLFPTGFWDEQGFLRAYDTYDHNLRTSRLTKRITLITH